MAVSVSSTYRSGAPYTITTGRDDNGDGVFADRPPGTSRNSARGTSHLEVGSRFAYTLGFGKPRPNAGSPGAPQVVVLNSGSGGFAPGVSGGPPETRYRFEFYVAAQNLLNRTNYTAYSDVMTSPLFGRPTSTGPPRPLQLGVRFLF